MFRKKYLGGTDKFFTQIWGLTPKKRSSSQITPQGYSSLFAFFRGTILARGNTFLACRGATESYGADLGSCPQIQGEDRSKRSSPRNLRLRLGAHLYFSSWNETLLTVGEGNRFQNALQWHWACYFF